MTIEITFKHDTEKYPTKIKVYININKYIYINNMLLKFIKNDIKYLNMK